MRAGIVLAAALAAFAPAADAAAQGSPNLLANPDAELGLTGWEGHGFRAARYGESRAVPPAGVARKLGLGGSLFLASRWGATLTQTVPVDPGTEAMTLWGLFGAPPDSPNGVSASVQWLDAGGAALTEPRRTGPPPRVDLVGEPTPLRCVLGMVPPPAARAARVTLVAVGQSNRRGTAFVDGLRFTPTPAVFTDVYVGPEVQGACTRVLAPLPLVSRIELSARRVAMRVSNGGRLTVAIDRRSRRSRWRRARTLRLRARFIEAHPLAARLSPPLRPGRYRVTALSAGRDGRPPKTAVARLGVAP